MLKVYILVVVIGLVGGVCYGGYYYYKDTQERIQTLTENNAKIMVAKQQQDQTINTFSTITAQNMTNYYSTIAEIAHPNSFTFDDSSHITMLC